MANVITVKDIELHIGDTVKITYKFKEGEKSKEQLFEGIMIKVRGEGDNKMFTVRKVGKDKIGIERVFSILSPYIDKIQVVKHASVRRAKLYYIRGLSDKTIRLRLSA
ncbi:MAG TPA: 50S ribosomal protein L19 [Candidatus Nitrosocosmicus sp.]|nr:50S ribosomal protein L19 [Candidatus Nitrosocosmicus sp.]